MQNVTRGVNAFARGWCDAFSRVCEMATGARPELSWQSEDSLIAPDTEASDTHFWWNQVIASDQGEAPVWVGTPHATWSKIVEVLGVGEGEEGRQAYADILSQTLMALAQEIAGRKRMRLTVPAGRAGTSEQPAELAFRTVRIAMAGEELPDLIVGIDSTFAAEIPDGARAGETTLNPPRSPLIDRLSDLELPVSVVLGRATLPVREVLNITTGSLIELGRQAGDPVELVVDHAVVARGEVVAVRGNYGVRIHELISRQDRLALDPARAAEAGR
ncbi:MAG: FliM/FliN family flagellar motor switch protein [Acidobacteriia bacterium]|nr:FliM/FliN family flagellar motor switch protein [Terriglobia bacterium]